MSVLLLRLAGPMQSWGTQSRFSHRDTGLEPSKSGVIGLLCAAVGWARDQERCDALPGKPSLEQFAASLTMGVRVDHEGRMACDFHTAGGSHRADQPYGVIRADGKPGNTVLSRRYYLADADFLVGLESGDLPLLQELHRKLQSPVWQLFLGRKSFVPGSPVWIPDGLRPDDTLRQAMEAYPWEPSGRKHDPERLRLVVETDSDDGEVRNDFPLSFLQRRFTIRRVRMEFIDAPAAKEAVPCT